MQILKGKQKQKKNVLDGRQYVPFHFQYILSESNENQEEAIRRK